MNQPSAFSSSDDPQPAQAGPNYLVWVLILVGVGMVGALLFLPRDTGRYGVRHASVGNAPERWRLEPLTGDPPPIELSDLRGKVTLVNYWGTWCPPCRVEFPHIVELWRDLKAEPAFQLAAVSCEPGIEKDIDALRATTAAYLAKTNSELPTYYDPQGISRLATMDTTGEELAYPTTVLFDRDGKVAAFWRGFSPGMEKEVEQAVRETLARNQ